MGSTRIKEVDTFYTCKNTGLWATGVCIKFSHGCLSWGRSKKLDLANSTSEYETGWREYTDLRYICGNTCRHGRTFLLGTACDVFRSALTTRSNTLGVSGKSQVLVIIFHHMRTHVHVQTTQTIYISVRVCIYPHKNKVKFVRQVGKKDSYWSSSLRTIHL